MRGKERSTFAGSESPTIARKGKVCVPERRYHENRKKKTKRGISAGKESRHRTCLLRGEGGRSLGSETRQQKEGEKK